MKRMLILLLLLALTAPAHAYYAEGTVGSKNAGTAPVTANLPTGTLNTSDVLIAVAACGNCSDMSTATSGWTQFNPTGSDAGHNLPWSTTNQGKVAIFWALQGAAQPVISTTITGGSVSVGILAAYGVDTTTPILAGQSVVTSSSLTINFPNFTPGAANEEAIFAGVGLFGAGTSLTTLGTIASCGITEIEDNSPNGFNVVTAGNPIMYLSEANGGPCTPGAAGSSSWTITGGSAANNIGVVLLLKPAAFAIQQPTHAASKFANMSGAFDFMTFNQGRSTYLDTPQFMPVLDGISVRDTWKHLEPTCGTYNTDYLDNQMINAQILGKKVAFLLQMGSDTQCGGAGEIACGSSTDNSSTADWVYSASTCHGSVTPTFINSIWTTGFGYPKGSPNLIMDPNATGNHTLEDSVINFSATRWGGITNIEAAGGTFLGNGGATIGLNNGPDGGTVTCNGTGTQCTAICGSPGCTVTIGDKAKWLAITPNGGGTYAATNGSGSSTTCSGTNQPWVVCDYEAGVQHYEQTWKSAFSTVALIPIHGATNNTPQGLFVTSDPFTTDMLAYDTANLTGVSSWMDTGLSCSPTGCPNPLGAAYLPYSSQPFLGVAFEENITEHNNTVGLCTTPPLYSIGPNNCTLPGIYYVLENVQFPYIEFFNTDLEDAPSEPWLYLLHQIATQAQAGAWKGAISSSDQSQIMLPVR